MGRGLAVRRCGPARFGDAARRAGYATAIGWKILWGVVTLAAWIFGDVDRGWIAAVIWFVFAGMVSVISGWAEPDALRADED
jgi:hypothetical protein